MRSRGVFGAKNLMDEKRPSTPLISVGIPTYNRPDGLHRTLECITRQTYQNLEIIISDNCSPSNFTERVVQEFKRNDARIRSFRQKKNHGSMFNFKFVLEKATGEFFMWAADDDEWEPDFIEKCSVPLQNSYKNYEAVITEAQYFVGKHRFEFFREGEPFYSFYSNNKIQRLKFMLKNNYGNLFYSLFRRKSLFQNGQNLFDLIKIQSLNEIFVFLFVIQRGNWKLLPEVGFYKQATKAIYEGAKWEKMGGKLPNSGSLSFYLGLSSSFLYHINAIKAINQIIKILQISKFQRATLKVLNLCYMIKHICDLILRKKDSKKN